MKTENEHVSKMTEWSRKIVPTKMQLFVICLAGALFPALCAISIWYVAQMIIK
ncbi:MAG: hypothetical protein LBK07_10175 [Tannerella sp.]|jgi:hypothetical protein|nr:hypothetical protein [Tannerella sp.]